MSALAEVAAYVATLSLGSPAPTVVKGQLPDAPASCIAVLEYGGPPPDLGFGVAGIQYEYPALQLLFRGEPNDYASPRALAETVYQELAKVQAESIGSPPVYYHFVKPQQAPFLLERDGQQRCVIAFNVVAEKVPS